MSDLERVEYSSFLGPIKQMLDEYEQHLRNRPWRDKGELENFEVAKKNIELLVAGGVAVQVQDDPGELARLREKVKEQEGISREYRRQIQELGRAHTQRLREYEAIEARIAGKEALTCSERAELTRYRKGYEKMARRLTAARATIKELKTSVGNERTHHARVHLLRALSCLMNDEEVTNDPPPTRSIRVTLGAQVGGALGLDRLLRRPAHDTTITREGARRIGPLTGDPDADFPES